MVVDGVHDIVPGIRVVPTSGHSPGHQSLLIDSSEEGAILLAGKAFDTASEFAAAALAVQLNGEPHDLASPAFMNHLLTGPIDVALFAHDLAQWRAIPAPFQGSLPRPPWPP